MEPVEIRERLEDTLDEFEHRAYLGMSAIGDCPFMLYRDLVYGRRQPAGRGRRMFHEGYLHQRDLLDRLTRAGLTVEHRELELVAPFDPRFRGHIDGLIGDSLVECKTVEMDADLDEIYHRGPRRRDRMQVQCYMYYGGWAQAFIVYKARADGALWIERLERDPAQGLEIEAKARMILAAVDREQPPACTCGRCR